MASYRIFIGPSPADVIRSLPPEIKRSVRNALRALGDDPSLGQALRGELEGLWRYRVRRFRIVYDVERSTRTLRVLAVGHRESIYDGLVEDRWQKRKRS